MLPLLALGYAAFGVPSNLLLYRFGARRWLARIMVSWGVVALGMVLVRTLLQFFSPGVWRGRSAS